MKFLIDADSPYSLLDVLRKYGHEAAHVRDIFISASDDEIFEYAEKYQFIIITRDLGFADMFMKDKGFGLILTRLPYYFKTEKIIGIFDEFFREVDIEIFIHSIVVLELGRYRIKKLG